MDAFIRWLEGELHQRNWSYNELARQAGLSSASVSQVMTGRQKPGLDFCRGVAEALNVPPERVFRLAGLLPPRPQRDDVIDEILFYYDQMTPQAQAHLRVIARAFAEGGGRIGEGEEQAADTGDAVAPA
jgi:transcriptional regulator with XRE-family HTH domain